MTSSHAAKCPLLFWSPWILLCVIHSVWGGVERSGSDFSSERVLFSFSIGDLQIVFLFLT